MRHIIAIVTMLAMAQGTALANDNDDTSKIKVGPPPESCVMQDLNECHQALGSCQDDQKALLDYVRQQCPAFEGKTDAQIVSAAKAPPAPKSPPPKVHKTKVVDDGKAKTPKVKVEPPKPATVIGMDRFTTHDGCPGGGLLLTTKVGDKQTDAKVLCDGRDGKDGHDGTNGKNGRNGRNGRDGKDGSSGRPGKDGDTRVQFGLGMRASAIHSDGRPNGYSAAPEASLELWLAPTVEFVAGVAWAPDGDRNMVVTGQLRHRGVGSRIGIGLGVQYQAWNLQGNKALWQSVLGMVDVQLVLVETKHIDISLEAGVLAGLDGYDAAAKFGIGGTGQVSAALKF